MLKTRTLLRTILAAGVLAVALTACASSTTPGGAPGAPLRTTDRAKIVPNPTPSREELIPPAPSPLAAPAPPVETEHLTRAALLVPLTGPSAAIGEALLNAAQMALFDVADAHLVLQVYDTGGTPEDTARMTEKAISEGAQIILGPVFAADAKAASPIAQAAGVNIVTFSTDASLAGGNVYVLGFMVQEQVREIVTFARSQGHTRFAILAPDSPYGQAAVDAFRAAVPALGGVVSKVGIYAASGNNLDDIVKQIADFDQRKRALAVERARLGAKTDDASKATLEQLKQSDSFGAPDFDAILLPEQGVRLTRAAGLLPYYDVDPGQAQMLGTLLWNAPNLGQEPELVGGWFPAPSLEGNRQFQARYKDLYGHPPPSIASHGYDAVALAAALARSGVAHPFAAATLTSPSGFSGIDGIFRFMPNGLSERSFDIMEVAHGGPVLVQPGATTFAGTGM